MEYSVSGLARLAGVSPRTIRYYDEIGLLCPERINSSGYRIYGQKELDLLQQILFFRSFNMELEKIKSLINSREFNKLSAMENHLNVLKDERGRIDTLISNAEKTIGTLKGEIKMSDAEKFEGFKKELINENEKKYGVEIREKYGDESVDASNAKMMKLTKEQYEIWQQLSLEVNDTLKQAYATGNPAGELAQKTCKLHKEWLSYCGVPYSQDYHKSLGLMYAEDERFAAYYDKIEVGCAKFLKEAIDIFCSK